MKSTKTLFLTALAVGSLLAFGTVANAGDTTNNPPSAPPAGAPPAGQRGPGMRGPTLDQLATTLKLTDDQKAKVKPILDARDQKLKDLRADTTLSPEDRRTKMQAIRNDMATQMKAVLTPDQFDQWQKMNQRQRRPAPAGGNPPAAAPQQ
jgi:Spy/CpxP family protein refolding chaperone